MFTVLLIPCCVFAYKIEERHAAHSPPELVHLRQYGGTGPVDWPVCSAGSAAWQSQCEPFLLPGLPLVRRTSNAVISALMCTVEAAIQYKGFQAHKKKRGL